MGVAVYPLIPVAVLAVVAVSIVGLIVLPQEGRRVRLLRRRLFHSDVRTRRATVELIGTERVTEFAPELVRLSEIETDRGVLDLLARIVLTRDVELSPDYRVRRLARWAAIYTAKRRSSVRETVPAAVRPKVLDAAVFAPSVAVMTDALPLDSTEEVLPVDPVSDGVDEATPGVEAEPTRPAVSHGAFRVSPWPVRERVPDTEASRGNVSHGDHHATEPSPGVDATPEPSAPAPVMASRFGRIGVRTARHAATPAVVSGRVNVDLAAHERGVAARDRQKERSASDAETVRGFRYGRIGSKP